MSCQERKSVNGELSNDERNNVASIDGEQMQEVRDNVLVTHGAQMEEARDNVLGKHENSDSTVTTANLKSGMCQGVLTREGPNNSKVFNISDLYQIPVRTLTGCYHTGNSILLKIPDEIDKCTFAGNAYMVLHKVCKSLEPEMTYQRISNELGCRGYFTHDYETCAFEAHIWQVDSSFAINPELLEYICELRRKSCGGRDAFDKLRDAVAVGLKSAGYADNWANGFAIDSEFRTDYDGLNDTYSSSEEYPVSLSSDSARLLCSYLVNRRHPQYRRTFRLLVRFCAGSKHNCRVLEQSKELWKAVYEEVSKGSDVCICLNALRLIEMCGIAPKDISSAIVQSLLLYCGKHPLGYEGMRCRALENAIVGALNVLVGKMQVIERERVIRTVENRLRGKLNKALCSDIPESGVIKVWLQRVT